VLSNRLDKPVGNRTVASWPVPSLIWQGANFSGRSRFRRKWPKVLGNTFKGAQLGSMLSILRPAVAWLIAALALVAANCSKPVAGEKELLGKIKGKASLRLADGSTISRDDSDEYSPYLLKLSDGYLLLVFGSNRTDCASCTGHNVFMAKSITAFNGEFIPYFSTPVPARISTNPINEPSRISFAATASGTSVVLYLNYSSGSNQIHTGTYSDPQNPTVGSLSLIANSNHYDNTIIGISADGTNLFSTDTNGIGYVFDPTTLVTANPHGYGMDYASSATQVRQENSGLQDSILGVYYGMSYTAAGQDYFGGLPDLDLSLLASGLYLSQLSTFYTDDPFGDTVLFSAWDGISDDIYVITSHTAYDLWYSVPFFGIDQFLPAAPVATHWYDMQDPAVSCPDVGSDTTWTATCSNVSTLSTGSYNGGEAGGLDGSSSNIDLGTQDVGDFFTLAAWIYLDSTATCSSCVIAANSNLTPLNGSGFRFYIDKTTKALFFHTGNGSTSATAETDVDAINFDQWHHITVTVNRTFGYALIFVDGIVLSTMPTALTDFSTSGTLSFMRTGGDSPILGSVDDIKIFDTELDALSVLSLATTY